MERFVDPWPILDEYVQDVIDKTVSDGFVVKRLIGGNVEISYPEYFKTDVICTIEKVYENHKRVVLGKVFGIEIRNDINSIVRLLHSKVREYHIKQLLNRNVEDMED